MGDETVKVSTQEVEQAQAGLDAALSNLTKGEEAQAGSVNAENLLHDEAFMAKFMNLLKAKGVEVSPQGDDGSDGSGEQATSEATPPTDVNLDEAQAHYVDGVPMLKSFRDAIDAQSVLLAGLVTQVGEAAQASSGKDEVISALVEVGKHSATLVKSMTEKVEAIAATPTAPKGVLDQATGRTQEIVTLAKGFNPGAASGVPKIDRKALKVALEKSQKDGKLTADEICMFELSGDPRTLPEHVLTQVLQPATQE